MVSVKKEKELYMWKARDKKELEILYLTSGAELHE
jgi:hypothetical protein